MPDIEKKKKRRRSARFYVNANRPIDPEAAALIGDFPPDDDEDGPTPAHTEARSRTRAAMRPDEVKRDFTQSQRRELARRGMALADGSYPVETESDLHNAAVLARSGHGDVKGARKLIARRAKELGVANPMESAEKGTAGNPAPHPAGGSWTDRLSPGRVAGQAAASSGDHNAAAWSDPMSQPGPRELAFRHPDLRQGTVNALPLFTMETAEGHGPADGGVPFAMAGWLLPASTPRRLPA